ncbi:PQQ-dependent sugar dehydrogenase [Pedobacter alpinus]|uniref:PQQ-dependent sugar dehydrogenase n=1 Tax=Pedobacter alpinus TaxID=1590643 RepID=A0ABW5TVK1_9SPHI
MLNLKTAGILSIISITALLSFNLKEKPIEKNGISDTPEANYQANCSGCHGAKMNAFVDRKWKYGKTPEDLFKSIKNGYKEDGMPAFAETFKDEEIKELANYIIKGIENVDRYNENEKPKSDIFETEEGKIKLVKVFDKVKIPWGIAFLPNKKMLVTDKSGELYIVNDDKSSVEVENVPEVRFAGQGGLMDVILHPNFASNQIIYLSYSKPNPTDASLQTTAILKAKLEGNKLVDAKDIFIALPYSKTRHHYGSRMVFGKDGLLYFSVGERGNNQENPQDTNNALGKLHRITDNGEIPKDNPFYGKAKAQESIFSYGHRNQQGLVLNPFTNEIWSHEHGPRGGDEINIHKKGANYGWAVVSYGINYNGKIMTPFTQKEGITDPIHYWIPSIAPSGMAFVNSDIYKGWKGNLMVGSLRFQYLNRCVIKDGKVIKEELLFKNIGRLREVRMAPDGYIYIGVEGEGVYKLMPI